MVVVRPRVVAIVQARMSSSRLPGKVLLELNGEPTILRIVDRLKKALTVDEVIVATSLDVSDDQLFEILHNKKIECFRGDLEDVLSRFIGVLSNSDAEVVIRVTADCPLVMPKLVDQMVNDFFASELDYLSNTITPTFPDGLDVEIFTKEALMKLNFLSLSSQEREHVTLGIRNRPELFSMRNFAAATDLSNLRWTVDYEEDFVFVREVYAHFEKRESDFECEEVLQLLEKDGLKPSTISPGRRNEALLKPLEGHN
jgi:spore coat polysaccharide biosynthesis protein SpsF